MNLDKYEIPDPVSWCEKNITLDYGKFKRENHPLLIDPLTAAANMRGGIVGLIGSVQHIKTLGAQLNHLYGANVEPTRAAIYDLNEKALKEFSDDKFSPLIDSTDVVADVIPKQGYRRTKTFTGMPYGLIRLLSANVLAARNSKTFERISCDESWAYEEGWLGQIRDRLASYKWSWQLFLPSSGQTGGSELDSYWERSTQKLWHVPCDCCGEMIPYIWKPPKQGDVVPIGGMRWGSKEETTYEDGRINYPALRESVYYECQLCGGKMRPDMGKQTQRNLKGRYIQTNPRGEEKLDFYHYNAMSHFPWPDLVEQWLEAVQERDRGKLSGIENFIRKRLAEKWNETDYVSKDTNVNNAGEYDLGDKWDPGVKSFKFCTVDVQKDHYYFVIREWANVGSFLRTRLLDRRKVFSDSEVVDACAYWEVPELQMRDGYPYCCIYADGNYNPTEVQRMAAMNKWLVFRGEEAKRGYLNKETGVRQIYGELKMVNIYEGTEDGARFAGQIPFSNQQAMNSLSLIRSIEDFKGKRVWTYPRNAGTMYENQINAWAKIKREGRNGSFYYDWIQTYVHDHYHSCEKMQMPCVAMADLMGSPPEDEGEDKEK